MEENGRDIYDNTRNYKNYMTNWQTHEEVSLNILDSIRNVWDNDTEEVPMTIQEHLRHL